MFWRLARCMTSCRSCPVITLVVFFHELGHFSVARSCGVKVETFSSVSAGDLRLDRPHGHALEDFLDAARRLCEIRRRRQCRQQAGRREARNDVGGGARARAFRSSRFSSARWSSRPDRSPISFSPSPFSQSSCWRWAARAAARGRRGRDGQRGRGRGLQAGRPVLRDRRHPRSEISTRSGPSSGTVRARHSPSRSGGGAQTWCCMRRPRHGDLQGRAGRGRACRCNRGHVARRAQHRSDLWSRGRGRGGRPARPGRSLRRPSSISGAMVTGYASADQLRGPLGIAKMPQRSRP